MSATRQYTPEQLQKIQAFNEKWGNKSATHTAATLSTQPVGTAATPEEQPLRNPLAQPLRNPLDEQAEVPEDAEISLDPRIKELRDKWAKHKTTVDRNSATQSTEKGVLGHAKDIATGFSKGAHRGLTYLAGETAELGSAHLEEEEPEDKFLTKFAKTGKVPDQDKYDQTKLSTKEHQKNIENAIAPDYFNTRAEGYGGYLENYIEKAIPNAAKRAVFSGFNPYVIGTGLVADAVDQAGYPKIALGIDLAGPSGFKAATNKAYALAKAARPAGKVVKTRSLLEPLGKALEDSSNLNSRAASKFLKGELHHKAALLTKKQSHSIEDVLDFSKDISKLANKVKTMSGFSKDEINSINKILFDLSPGLKEAAYAVPGAQKFAELNRAADHAASVVFNNPGITNRLAKHLKEKPWWGLAAGLGIIPGASKGIVPAAATAGAISLKDLAGRVIKDPILRNHYFRAKSAAALELFDIVDEELKYIDDHVDKESDT